MTIWLPISFTRQVAGKKGESHWHRGNPRLTESQRDIYIEGLGGADSELWPAGGGCPTSTGGYGIQQHWDIDVVVLRVANYFLHVLYKQDSTNTVLGWSFKVFPSCNCFVWKISHAFGNAILFICSIVQPSSVCTH